jgi:hypothetical protein
MRWRVAAGFAVVAVSLGAGEVQAQAPPPPGYSPYLNLVRPGNPGANYYGLVRPQVEFRADLLRLQRNTTALQTGLSQMSGGDLTTGHAAGFMYYGGYYPGLSRGGAPARSLPNMPPPPSRSPITPPGGYRR